MLKDEILLELNTVARQVDPKQLFCFTESVQSAGRVFVHGKGRMGLVLKAFAMGLYKIGIDVYFVGDMTVPPIIAGDLLIVAPIGGYPKASTGFIQVARKAGAIVAAYTTNRDGPVGDLADIFMEVPARPLADTGDKVQSIQPMSTTVEQVGMVLFSLIIHLLCGTEKSEYERILDEILKNMSVMLTTFDDKQIVNLKKLIESADHLFFVATGLDSILLSFFAMRLTHIGRDVYVVNEIRWPAPKETDVVISLCGSSCDRFIQDRLQIFKDTCARIFGFFREIGSPRLSIHEVSSARISSSHSLHRNDTPEEFAYLPGIVVVFDYIVSVLMQQWNLSESDLWIRHTNLE